MFFAVMGLSVLAQNQNPQASEDSCRTFVQTFYDWYSRRAVGLHADPLDAAIKDKRQAFSTELLQLIKDSKARALAEQEVWLDFEPILNTQDQGQHYVVGNVNLKNETNCRAEVHTTYAGKSKRKPRVVPELEFRDGQWVFINFHYPNSNHPDNENLVRILKK
jgi:hypothetical protein